MTITREDIAAFADGELPPAREAEIAAALAADPAIAREVEAHRALKTTLRRHLDPVAAEPVPEAMAAMLVSGPRARTSSVLDFTAARDRRATKRGLPRWSWIAGPALAASLALALFVPRGEEGAPDYAGVRLTSVLDDRLVAEQLPDAQTRVLLSFRSRGGEYCRVFRGSAESGIACRDNRGWRIETTGQGRKAQTSDYRMAGATQADLMARAQRMADGPALDADAEAEARGRGWR